MLGRAWLVGEGHGIIHVGVEEVVGRNLNNIFKALEGLMEKNDIFNFSFQKTSLEMLWKMAWEAGKGNWEPGTGSFFVGGGVFPFNNFLIPNKVSEHLRRLGAPLGNTCTSPGKWWYRPEVSYWQWATGWWDELQKKVGRKNSELMVVWRFLTWLEEDAVNWDQEFWFSFWRTLNLKHDTMFRWRKRTHRKTMVFLIFISVFIKIFFIAVD